MVYHDEAEWNGVYLSKVRIIQLGTGHYLINGGVGWIFLGGQTFFSTLLGGGLQFFSWMYWGGGQTLFS